MNLYSKIDEVMDRFEFDKVHRVMTFLNWTWAQSSGNCVPTVETLKAEAYRQLSMAIDLFVKQGQPLTGMVVASGGFQASVETFISGPPKLQLLFYVDSRSNFS